MVNSLGTWRSYGGAQQCLLAMAFAFLSLARATGLNDTGTWICSDNVWNTSTAVEADGGTAPRQDCRYGRTPAAMLSALPYVGGYGGGGFDFTRIANDGSEIPGNQIIGPGAQSIGTGPKDWACMRDNVTGLIWELKTASGLRSQSHSYSWYNSNGNTNGGVAGTVSGGTCESSGRCDTEKYVSDVNAMGLCGAADWRIPTIRELISVVNFYSTQGHWVGTGLGIYWSNSTYASISSAAWSIGYVNGATAIMGKNTASKVQLVRTGQ